MENARRLPIHCRVRFELKIWGAGPLGRVAPAMMPLMPEMMNHRDAIVPAITAGMAIRGTHVAPLCRNSKKHVNIGPPYTTGRTVPVQGFAVGLRMEAAQGDFIYKAPNPRLRAAVMTMVPAGIMGATGAFNPSRLMNRMLAIPWCSGLSPLIRDSRHVGRFGLRQG